MDKQIKVIVTDAKIREEFGFTEGKVYDATVKTGRHAGTEMIYYFLDNDIGRTVGMSHSKAIKVDGRFEVVEQC